ncbi:MAG: hypothetical protein H6729_15880 [Deltaproteobacteria bacterium]|nr:hypothetical protein [Deltaproteobacteria bacterium]
MNAVFLSLLAAADFLGAARSVETSTRAVDTELVRSAQGEAAPPARISGLFRVSSGAEWDTNARRTVTGPRTQDALGRLTIDLATNWRPESNQHEVGAHYILGVKRFGRTRAEDLLAHDLEIHTDHWLGPWISVGTLGSARASRTHARARNYGVARGQLSARLHPPDAPIDVELLGGFNRFRFHPEHRFSYTGPDLTLKAWVHIGKYFNFGARGGYGLRSYAQGLVRGTTPIDPADPNTTPSDAVFDPALDTWVDSHGTRLAVREFITFCGESESEKTERKVHCTPASRQDREWSAAASAEYNGAFRVGAEYLARVQRSTSIFENVDRHRISAYGHVGLPWRLTASFLAAVQFNHGRSASEGILFAEDDENQNSLEVQLSHRVLDNLSIDLRGAIFVYQFTTSKQSFVRQTAYLGVSYRGSGP